MKIYGVPHHPVIHPDSRITALVLRKAHVGGLLTTTHKKDIETLEVRAAPRPSL